MTKYNYNYAKPDENSRPLYGPMPLSVEIPHHEEWDEPVVDEETGEPTGETRHMERDWTERKTVIRPKRDEFALMGYLRILLRTLEEPPEGKHWERTGTIESYESGYAWIYVLVDNPPPPPRRWSVLSIIRALKSNECYDEIKSALESAGLFDEFIGADYISEDDDSFRSGYAMSVEEYGQEKVDAILDSIPREA
jgi:hypothetical protein